MRRKKRKQRDRGGGRGRGWGGWGGQKGREEVCVFLCVRGRGGGGRAERTPRAISVLHDDIHANPLHSALGDLLDERFLEGVVQDAARTHGGEALVFEHVVCSAAESPWSRPALVHALPIIHFGFSLLA